MSQITKHHGKQKGERYNGVRCWIHFSITRNTVCINECLKSICKLIRAIVRRWILKGLHSIENWRHRRSTPLRTATQCNLNGLNIKYRHPTFRNETLLCHVQIKEIERVIDCLDFAHFHEPILQVLRRRHEDTVPMILSLAQYSVQILNACHHTHCHFPAIRRCLWAWVQCCPETFANLLHACLQLIALEENDEHRFVHIVALK
uniref:Uncharacterized protein n=1 Tax=Lutzomyia longipalpis TaxID=7200 RepID=A0A1B0CGE4_LUTLO